MRCVIASELRSSCWASTAGLRSRCRARSASSACVHGRLRRPAWRRCGGAISSTCARRRTRRECAPAALQRRRCPPPLARAGAAARLPVASTCGRTFPPQVHSDRGRRYAYSDARPKQPVLGGRPRSRMRARRDTQHPSPCRDGIRGAPYPVGDLVDGDAGGVEAAQQRVLVTRPTERHSGREPIVHLAGGAITPAPARPACPAAAAPSRPGSAAVRRRRRRIPR
jgi:hypothetical protein